MTSSKMLEGYCTDVEHLLREGSLREAVRLAVALPDICASLESPRLRSTHEDYVRWCESWLKLEAPGPERFTGARVFGLYARNKARINSDGLPDSRPRALMAFRMRRFSRGSRSLGRPRLPQADTPIERFQVRLSEALLIAARAWYDEHGSDSPVVQANLGKLAVR